LDPSAPHVFAQWGSRLVFKACLALKFFLNRCFKLPVFFLFGLNLRIHCAVMGVGGDQTRKQPQG
jgi:hypothetical protein